MNDTVEVSTAILFWIIFGSMVAGAMVAWLATWDYWRRYANEHIWEIKDEYRSDQSEIRNARIVQQVHDGLSMQDWREL